MSGYYFCSVIEVTEGVPVTARWVPSGRNFHLCFGGPCNDVTVMIGEEQLERLASVIRVAQMEHAESQRCASGNDNDGCDVGGDPLSGARHSDRGGAP